MKLWYLSSRPGGNGTYSIRLFSAISLIERRVPCTALITAPASSLKLCARPVPQLIDARDVAVLEEPQVHVHHVVDVDEVAALLAVAVAARADEQLHLAAAEELVIGVVGHRRHAPLVGFVRAVDVEVAEAGDLRFGCAGGVGEPAGRIGTWNIRKRSAASRSAAPRGTPGRRRTPRPTRRRSAAPPRPGTIRAAASNTRSCSASCSGRRSPWCRSTRPGGTPRRRCPRSARRLPMNSAWST